MSGHEDDVFASLQHIYDAIAKATQAISTEDLATKTCIQARTTDRNESMNGTFKHDANQRLTQSLGAGKIKTGAYYACDSVTAWEFKKSDINDSVNQVFTSLQLR